MRALFSFACPFQVPETPFWLLSKNRTEEACKSLQWLRGWVSPNGVRDEFIAMQRYVAQSLACEECAKQAISCNHPRPTIVDKLRSLFYRNTLRPLMLTFTLFLFAQFSGYPPMRPYLVVVLKAYGIPIDPNWATVSNEPHIILHASL